MDKQKTSKKQKTACNYRTAKKVKLQDCLDSLIELHKLQSVLLKQMNKEI